ncbi:SF1B family DNA helicase RecD2 [Lentibacillus sp. Marseille-P4043]|uniref:SF1B family DNA helicase RecD2 n=1 Tax=Lentibacillus sp. Marseille-P4043 TaxID=2040293 RepID=UPI000D0BD83D|nr:ATP-dependent RecD-like DNA helicase [Lentibacillus sp. Marseille-P4043]
MAHERDMMKDEEQGYITGELLYTIFHNETEHFSIAKIKIQDTNEDYREKDVVAKGYFSNLQTGKKYRFYGQFERHVKFGLQYQVTSYQTVIPNTKDGLVAYLSSDLFHGIGKKTAKRIIDHLGENAISKILNQPSVLDGVPGLKKDKADTLVKNLQENQGFEHIVVYLAKYGIGLKMAQKIYQEYKEDAITQLEEDPYQYVFDIEGFGFQKADEIASQNGLSLTHPNRIGAGCIYVLQKSVQDGHVYLPLDSCVEQVIRLLYNADFTLSAETIQDRLEELNKEKIIILQNGHVYLPSLYYAEDGFASHLKRLISKPVEQKTTLAELMTIIGKIEEEEILSYGKEQFKAINQSLDSKITIVTGGPGTGKTTVIKGILQAYAAIHAVSMDPKDYDTETDFPFVLTAPTGRAAKRLNESTGLPAVTIHRLLGWDGKNGFEKNQHEQLAGKFIIIDEFSMVDIWLANSLFKAIPDDMQVLLVGDEDQLPSVGPGQVLSDLLGSTFIPYVQLSEVYRQKEGSKIIQLAHQIKNDICTVESLQNDKDFSFIPCHEQQMIDVIVKIYEKAKNKGLDTKDIQVLAPMYRSQAGITMINKHLQQLINPKTNQKREVKLQDVCYRVGDKVIQLVNQPEDHVYNGDIGEVVAIFEEDENTEQVEQLVIAYEGKEVIYERKDYVNIMHAYCISIHKSQGSEFPIVLLPVVSTYNRMLRKNLLYTAITRSKQSLIICGEVNAFLRGVQTLDTNIRFTSLKELLQERLTNQEMATSEEDEEELTPYDFM